VDCVEGDTRKGNPAADEKVRCYVACYNTHIDKSWMGSRSKHLNTISRDPHCPIGPPLEYLPSYTVLIKKTDVLLKTGVDAGSGVDGSPTQGDGSVVEMADERNPQGWRGED